MKALADRLAKTPALAKEVGAKVGVVVGGEAWLLDLTGPGSVTAGKTPANVTLTLADDALVALTRGASLRDLYQHGKVRVDGDAHLAPKLNFFKGLA
jgi:3-hydroxyacyl-CoA dehydrogenase/3a,7a,12a-trihydroxy-5b-cholest-24-enoyl-CoA hydratase